jgi:hypothetical protein
MLRRLALTLCTATIVLAAAKPAAATQLVQARSGYLVASS